LASRARNDRVAQLNLPAPQFGIQRQGLGGDANRRLDGAIDLRVQSVREVERSPNLDAVVRCDHVSVKVRGEFDHGGSAPI
jgi:hypothetical protein